MPEEVQAFSSFNWGEVLAGFSVKFDVEVVTDVLEDHLFFVSALARFLFGKDGLCLYCLH